MQVTQEFREAARLEAAEAATRSRMTEGQKQQLAALKQRRLENQSFAEQFEQLDKDSWTLVQMLKRIYAYQNSWTVEVTYDARGEIESVIPVRKSRRMNDAMLERMALKLRRSLAIGWKVTEPHDIAFLATLTREEERMGEEAFFELMTGDWPQAEKEEDKLVRCALGAKCLRAVRRQAALVSGGKGRFCGPACRGRSKATLKRSKHTEVAF